MDKRPAPVRPELQRALVDLLRAEQDFTRAYGAWALAPSARQPILRDELAAVERRIEAAEREVMKWQARPRREDEDDE